jgi:hypothetical protein
MSNHGPLHFFNFASMPVAPFEIDSLGSEALTRLFQETDSYIHGIRIEMAAHEKAPSKPEEHPASTLGLQTGNPAILFVDSLEKEERIEAISHELGHMLLVYRFGLRWVGLRIPHREKSEEIFRHFLNRNRSWAYLLGQIPNTIHHLILIDYLKEEYGIDSHRHARFLDRHFRGSGNENGKDEEFLYARGLVAFECEKLLGEGDRVIEPRSQSEFLGKAYHAAQTYFGNYRSSSVPTPADYADRILSFLEDLGYKRNDFTFFPSNS